jgi:hypothetical protein
VRQQERQLTQGRTKEELRNPHQVRQKGQLLK